METGRDLCVTPERARRGSECGTKAGGATGHLLCDGPLPVTAALKRLPMRGSTGESLVNMGLLFKLMREGLEAMCRHL